MEKIIVSDKTRKNGVFDYNGSVIEVIPYIPLDIEATIINDYVGFYFNILNFEEPYKYLKNGNFDYHRAELALIQRIMKELTNMDTIETSADVMVDVFYKAITYVENYDQFRNRLDKTVQSIKDSKSLGIVIDGLVTSIEGIIQSFQGIDPVQLKALADEIVKKVEESPASEIFKEAAQQNAIEKNVVEKKSKTKKVKEIKE